MNKKNLGVSILILVLIAGGLYFWKLWRLEIEKNTPVKTTNETSDWKTYVNPELGFRITLTDAWKGYKVFSSQGSQGVGAPTYLQFSMPTSDKTKCVMSVTDEVCGYVAPFTIIIIAKDRSVSTVDGKITEDKNNAYYYSLYNHFNELPNDLNKIDFEIPKIISTFKFTK